MRGIGFLGVAAALAASLPAAAETPANPDSVRMTVPEVVVTALRGRDRIEDIPAAAFVLDRQRVLSSGVLRLSTLLGSLPGLYGYRQDGSGEPAVVDPRGFTANGESSYLKVLVNGRDVRDTENGAVDWDWVLADEVERVEVVQGSGAWLYGDGAEGGIVNLVRPVRSAGLHSDCGLRAGSFGLGAGSLVLSAAEGPWAGAARGSLKQLDGFRDRSGERVLGLGTEASARAGRLRFGVDAGYLDADRDDPGSLTREQIRADREQSETVTDRNEYQRLMVGGHATLESRPGLEWMLAPYLRHEEGEQVRTIFFAPLTHPTEALATGLELTGRGAGSVGGKELTWAAGAQAEGARLDSDYRDDIGSAGAVVASARSRRTTYSGFANAKLSLESTSYRLGVRGDAIRLESEDRLAGTSNGARTLSSVSPFASMTHRVPGGSVWLTFSTAFRVPTLSQLYDRRPFFDPGSGGFITISNPDLDPQRSTGFELGTRFGTPRGGSATLALYSIRVRDEIDFDLATFSYANLGKSWHRGIELALAHPIGGAFQARLQGAWTPTTIVEGSLDGNQINAVPEGSGYAALAWSNPRTWEVESGVRYTGRQFLDKQNVHALADHATLEMAGSIRLARARAVVRLANLLDRHYEDTGFVDAIGEPRFAPAAGRSVTLGVTFDPAGR